MITFSQFQTVFSNDDLPSETTIQQVWDDITRGKYYKLVEQIRGERDKSKRSELKKRLPAITPQSLFSTPHRTKTAPHTPRPYICVDVDDLTTEDAESLRTRMGHDPHCNLSFLSPSGQGVKAVFSVSNGHADSLDIFYTAQKYVEEVFGVQIDAKCKGADRACFLSWDPGAIYRDVATPLTVTTRPEPKPVRPTNLYATAYDGDGGETPLDDYSKRATQETIEGLLSSAGWTPCSHDRLKWTRPGKSSGTSGVINPPDARMDVWSFYSHSSSVDFDTDKAYTAGALFAVLQFGGDYSAAAKDLSANGYGSRRDAGTQGKTASIQAGGDISTGDASRESEAIEKLEEELIPFPTAGLPKDIRGFVCNVAKLNSVPESMVAATCFSAISTAVGNSVVVDSLPGQEAHCNLFVLTLAKSGTGKGQTQRAVMKPLLSAIDEAESQRINKDAPIAEKRLSELENDIQDLIDEGGNPESLLQEKATLERVLTPEKVIISDTTTETMLGYLGRNSHPAILSMSAEASQQFQNMSGRYSSAKGTNDDGTMCDLYSGDAVSYDRKSESHSLIGARVGISWMTQPHAFLSLLEDSNKIEGGFLARFLMHDSEAEVQGWPENVRFDVKSHALWKGVIEHLFHSYRANPAPDQPGKIPQTEGFTQVMRNYVNKCAKASREESIEVLAAFHNRHAENAYRLAVVLHMFEYYANPFAQPMLEKHAVRACGFIEWFAARQRDLLFPLLLEKTKEQLESGPKWVQMVKEAGEKGLLVRSALRSANISRGAFDLELAKMPEIEMRKVKDEGSIRATDRLFWIGSNDG